MASEPTLIFSFTAGVVSFLSPCMLPVIPAFIAHMAGTNLNEDFDRKRLFLTAVFFVAGFSIVFGILGVLINSIFESAGATILDYLSIVAGTMIMIFGAHLSGIVDFKMLNTEHKLGLEDKLDSGFLSSLLLGGAFAVGWTPCVGPILGSIFALASTSPGSAFVYLTSYSLGLGIPFLLVGAFPNAFMDRVNNHMGIVNKMRAGFGFIMILLGYLIMTGDFAKIASLGIINEVVL